MTLDSCQNFVSTQSVQQMDRISSNFVRVYTLILTISRLELLQVCYFLLICNRAMNFVPA